MVAFAPVQGVLNVAAQGGLINVVHQIQAFDDVVIFPQGASGLVFALVSAEFADDNTLGGRFKSQRKHNSLEVVPFFDDEGGVDLADRFERTSFVLVGVFETIKRLADFIVDVAVAGRELIAEAVEDGKIDFVGAVGVGGVDSRLNISGIVRHKIEHIVTFVFVGSNDGGVDGDMVSHQSVGDNPFFEAKVFGRIAGIDGVDAGFKFLTVTAGMDRFFEIIVAKKGERGDGIADEIIGLAQGFQADEVIRSGAQAMIGNIRDLTHCAQAHIGAPSHQSGSNDSLIGRLFGIAGQDVFEGRHKLAVLIGEMQHLSNIHLFGLLEESLVHGLANTGILERPATLFFELKMLILSGKNPLIDFGQAFFKLLFESNQMFLDWLLKNAQTSADHQFFFFSPLLIVHQIILETAKANAIAAEYIARFQAIA